jgi:DNA polymerase III subunit epsilon
MSSCISGQIFWNMKNLTFIAFDIETATNNSASICQIGYVVVKNGQITSEKSYLVQPPNNEFEARHSCIHGIDSLLTKEKPLFPEIWDIIKGDFIESMLVAHNANFDLNILISTLDYYKLPIPKLTCECTFKISGLKLKTLAESLNISIDKHHDALSDARACAQAYILLKNGIVPNLQIISKSESTNIFAGHERLTGNILKPNLDIENTSNPFYSKKVVFTGVLQKMTRDEAAKKIRDMGADIDTGVNKRTDYVIAGHGAGPSKLKKINDFNLSGSHIKIINEDEFLLMIR